MPDIFISYSRDDSLAMETIRDNLRKLGFNLWIDIEHLNPGTPQWERAVRDAVRNTDVMLVLCSPAAEISKWVNIEVTIAELSGKFIIPIWVYGDDELEAIPPRLINIQRVDMRGRSNPAGGFSDLTTSLANHFAIEIPDYQFEASAGQIPTIQVINVHGHVEGHIVAIGRDVEGDVNIAGGDITQLERLEAPPPPARPTAESDAEDDIPITETSFNFPSASTKQLVIGKEGVDRVQHDASLPWVWIGGIAAVVVIGIIIGAIALSGRFGLGGGEATETPTPEEAAVVTETPVESTPTNPFDNTSAWVSGEPIGMIVYTCYDGSFDNICIINADGTGQEQLTDANATDFYGSFSPDGQTILFSSNRGGNFDIYTMNTSGENVTRITQDHGDNFSPALSFDSSQIVFASTANTDEDQQHIWVMSSNGDNMRQLTFDGDDHLNGEWSPDGDFIVFTSNDSGTMELYLMRSDGSNVRQLTFGMDIGGRSDWSPDGSLIAFYADDDIYTIRPDGSNLQQITHTGDNKSPSFSPDGGWLTYASTADGDNEIVICRIDGSDQRQLTFNKFVDWQPRWGR